LEYNKIIRRENMNKKKRIRRFLISERDISDKSMLTIENINANYGLDIKKILQIEKNIFSFHWEIFYQ